MSQLLRTSEISGVLFQALDLRKSVFRSFLTKSYPSNVGFLILYLRWFICGTGEATWHCSVFCVLNLNLIFTYPRIARVWIYGIFMSKRWKEKRTKVKLIKTNSCPWVFDDNRNPWLLMKTK